MSQLIHTLFLIQYICQSSIKPKTIGTVIPVTSNTSQNHIGAMFSPFELLILSSTGVTRLVTRSNYFQKNLEILERPQWSWSLSSVLPLELLTTPETGEGVVSTSFYPTYVNRSYAFFPIFRGFIFWCVCFSVPARKQPVNIFACRFLLALCFAIAICLLFIMILFLLPKPQTVLHYGTSKSFRLLS